MTFVWTLLQADSVKILVLTLLNTLWQGVVWLLLLMLALRLLPARRAESRYTLAVGSLCGIVLTGLVTWSLLSGHWRDAPEMESNTVAATVVRDEMTATATLVEFPALAAPITTPTVVGHTDSGNDGPGRAAPAWVPLFALLWICGCVLMLVRGLRSIAAARRLVCGRNCEDDQLLELLTTTQLRLGLRRPVRLVVTDVLSSPIIWGFWKPVLLLPASLASNLSIAELEAIFAHELAHVRRYDQVVNLLQLLIESILFFNPAVWWISRQVRLEREACCDAAAAGLTGNAIAYASLLAEHVERQSSGQPLPAVAPALVGSSDGTLLDRVRRLLLPAHRPGMRLSWWTCLLLIAVSGLVLYGLYRGTEVVVGVAARMMTDEERIETIAAQARRTTPTILEEPEFEDVRIRGQVVIAPSLTTVNEVQVNSVVRQGNHTTHNTIGAASTDFDVTVPAGTIWLFFSHQDAAVSILGPFGPQDGPDITDQTVVVTVGEDVTLRVVDDQNEPAAGVTVSASAVVNGNGIGSAKGTTNNEGIVQLRHILPDNDYSLMLSGPGYQQSDPPAGKLNPHEVATLEVSRASPARGVIVDEQGEPISGVQIYEYISQQKGHTNSTGGFEGPLATTDSHGAFVLDQLDDSWRYHLLLRHPQFAHGVLAGVQPGDENIRGTMVRGVTVRGTVQGAERMAADERQLTWGEVEQLPLGEHGALVQRTIRHLDRIEFGEDGLFVLENVAPGRIEIEFGSQAETFEISDEDSQIAIDYEPSGAPQTRTVVIRFEHDGQPVKPEGRLTVHGVPEQVGSSTTMDSDVRLTDGEARVEVPVPMSRRSLHADPDGLIGFWFNSHDVEWPVVPSGAAPYELVIPVHPAGAIEGRVLSSDGLPAVGVNVGVTLKFDYSGASHHTYSGGRHVESDTAGRFFITPLPLGASCVMTLSDGFYRQAGEEITLDGADPIRTVEMSMGLRREVEGRVVGPNGQSLRGMPVQLNYDHPRASMSWSPPATTDRDGRFRFAGLNAAADGEYSAEMLFHRDYVPIRAPLHFGGENEIRLETGRVLTGRALDESGTPVSGIEVYAMRADLELTPGAINAFEAEAVTDEQGRFRFSNLPDVRLDFNARQLHNERVVTVEAGDADQVTIQGKVATWFLELQENQ